MPERVIAYCGLDCGACPAFHASEKLSMAEREKIAQKWSQDFKSDFKATDIDCVGCSIPNGVHVGYCAMCKIRACAQERKLTTCAACPDFACQELEGFLKMAPQAKENLMALRH